MTEGHYASAATADTTFNGRRFLSSALSLNRLFTGTGYTLDERDASGPGTAEFLTENTLLSSIPSAHIIELPP